MSPSLDLPAGVALGQLLAFLGALGVGLVLTRWVMALALRLDFVSRPKGERWSARPVPLGGGVAISLVLLPTLATVSLDLFVGGLLVFLLGLIDDKRALSPAVKLGVQALAAGWMVLGPLDAGPAPTLFAGPTALALAVTGAWYVGLANSVNLLDNMDGSAAGVSAIAAGAVYVLAVGGPAPDPALAAVAAAAAGVSLAFLAFNFPPARVFMGDAGSLVLGFALAGLVVRLPRVDAGPLRELATAAFVLAAPLLDTALVWVSRRSARRPFLLGGRDHTTHRLLGLGLSERRTLLVIYGVAAVAGGAAVGVARGGIGTAVISALGAGVTLSLLGVFLGDLVVYAPGSVGRAGPARPHRWLLYGVEIGVDAALFVVAWLGAYALRFQGMTLSDPAGAPALPFYLAASGYGALPLVVAAKISALAVFGLYRGVWRTIRFSDAWRLVGAVTLASLLVVGAATALQRFEHYSFGVIAIDWLLSLVAVIASRSAIRALRASFGWLSARERRAVLLGPPGLGALVELDLANDARLVLVAELDPAAFALDAEESSAGEALVEAVREREGEVVLLGVPWTEDDPRVLALLQAGLVIRRMRLALD